MKFWTNGMIAWWGLIYLYMPLNIFLFWNGRIGESLGEILSFFSAYHATYLLIAGAPAVVIYLCKMIFVKKSNSVDDPPLLTKKQRNFLLAGYLIYRVSGTECVNPFSV